VLILIPSVHNDYAFPIPRRLPNTPFSLARRFRRCVFSTALSCSGVRVRSPPPSSQRAPLSMRLTPAPLSRRLSPRRLARAARYRARNPRPPGSRHREVEALLLPPLLLPHSTSVHSPRWTRPRTRLCCWRRRQRLRSDRVTCTPVHGRVHAQVCRRRRVCRRHGYIGRRRRSG
jgi:hypothetical protein